MRARAVLAVLAALTALLGVAAGPAAAATVVRTPDHVVLTTDRLSTGPLHATMIVDYGRDGNWSWTVNSHWGWMYREATFACTVFVTREHIPIRVVADLFGGRHRYVTDTGRSPQPNALLKQNFDDLQDGFDYECTLR